MKKMKVLITGANGQLGQEFQKLFEKENIEYIPTDHKTLGITKLKDIRELVKTEKNITHIINCAAYNQVDKAEKEWETAYKVNGLGPRNLAIIANEINAEIIHYSTDYVFDGNKKEPYTIYDEPKPINKYGESKVLGERFIQNIANKYYLIRVSWVFGIGNNNFAKKVIQWSKQNKILKIADDEISAPTYAVDLAKATYMLIKERAYGLYHITNTKASRYEWAEYILKKINWNGKLERASKDDFNLPAKRPGYSVLNNFGLKETINLEMPDWKDAMNRFLILYIRHKKKDIK
ncbi:dTDP-4-dehydrorhamnose reductase [Marinitoga hydrogenitolerans DSM 16785]|uniref:dTDP-4-dehydrorhamnose reductase n=1 Tax=Marinitoga hydrogenitolerans (strain DSM 16785 / JCM 12826 / AT1271) TaxID=1122195 RepID=A0A1M4ZCG7_MARH1|nr:dTDP-4-dehydrorhamnose reductase [Marinitoga hydrogenitolerans]SHF15744.1 dTDP-4-dehydrorhamnose reductase [Marinitoga hydrogenitolerans DSM 16785]